ncbi:MAG: hypothetical protein HQM09_21810 [Candidatus Riflebacteria bacterium]|nr:hypothetical protein [Candidatus Riflebacteria bacterium]
MMLTQFAGVQKGQSIFYLLVSLAICRKNNSGDQLFMLISAAYKLLGAGHK